MNNAQMAQAKFDADWRNTESRNGFESTLSWRSRKWERRLELALLVSVVAGVFAVTSLMASSHYNDVRAAALTGSR